jgi:tripartite-type tricarboxylate transporter receptor subunit TctC
MALFNRRALLATATGAALARPAVAQGWPTRPVRIINPWPPGGPGDQIIRPIAELMQTSLGQPVVIENRPGANGTLGANLVANAPPDGYMLYFAHTGAMTISPLVQPRLPYDPIRSFTPITQILAQGSVLAVRSGLPITTTQELIDYARARPGELNLGSIGIASTTHLFGELLAKRAGVRFTHVPYPGAAPLVTDLLAGRVDFSLLGLPAIAPHAEAGTLRILGITSAKPPRTMSDMPTINQTLPGFETESWYGILGPAGLPENVVTALHRALVTAIRSETITSLFARDSYEPVGNTPQEFAARIRRDLQLYGELVRELGIRID